MNIFELNKLAQLQLEERDVIFNEQVEVVTGILRSMGILPYRRMTINGNVHRLFSAMIVLTYNLRETIHIHTRKLETFGDEGLSTMYLGWLDKCVEADLLSSLSVKKIAEGNVSIGELIKNYCNTYILQTKQQSPRP